MDSLIALGLAACFSVLVCIIELSHHSKARLSVIGRQGASYIYLLVLLTGNTATTLAVAANIAPTAEMTATTAPAVPTAGTIQSDALADNAPTKSLAILSSGYAWFWYAFLGVFGFEAVLKNINVTFFDKGVLSISDWISKARDQAVTVTVAATAHEEELQKQAVATKLSNLPLADLDAHVLQALGCARHAALASAAPLTKALALAYENFGYAKVIH